MIALVEFPIDVFQKYRSYNHWESLIFFLLHGIWKLFWFRWRIFCVYFFPSNRTNHLDFFHLHFFFIMFVIGLLISKSLWRKKGGTIKCVIWIFVFFVEKDDCLCSWIIDFKIICRLHKNNCYFLHSHLFIWYQVEQPEFLLLGDSIVNQRSIFWHLDTKYNKSKNTSRRVRKN